MIRNLISDCTISVLSHGFLHALEDPLNTLFSRPYTSSSRVKAVYRLMEALLRKGLYFIVVFQKYEKRKLYAILVGQTISIACSLRCQ